MKARLWLLLPLVACGDPLYAGDELEDLLGLTPPPFDPAWELRWVSGDGLVVDCDLVLADLFFAEDIAFGEVELAPPEVDEPAAWVSVPEGRYAIGLAVLVDAFSYVPYAGASDLALGRGVWGAVSGAVAFDAEGQTEAIVDDLFLDPAASPALSSWVGLIGEIPTYTGDYQGSLYPLDGQASAGVPVTATAYLDSVSRRVLSGDGVGGLVAGETCR